MTRGVPDSGAFRVVSEQQIQRAVFAHLRARGAPGIVAWHPWSGGFRRPKEAAIYKGLGVIAGLPDVMVLYQSRLYGLELKRPKSRGATEIQLKTLAALDAAGAFTCVAEGLDRALAVLEAWGLLRGEANATTGPKQFPQTSWPGIHAEQDAGSDQQISTDAAPEDAGGEARATARAAD